MPDEMPDIPPESSDAIPQEDAPGGVAQATEQPTAPASGRRTSFRDIRRQLSEEELKQTGVQKLVIEDFERAEDECVALRLYVEKYHEADKINAALKEKLKANIAMDVISAVGFAGGGAIVSLAPSIWDAHGLIGILAVVVGLLFIAGSGLAKHIQGKR